MVNVTIYTRPNCPYCTRAIALLKSKGVAYSEIDALGEKRPEMVERSNGRNTFPQIFIGETHIGGCDDLYALEEAGKLDPMLARGQE